jgi:hypothetical protein
MVIEVRLAGADSPTVRTVVTLQAGSSTYPSGVS